MLRGAQALIKGMCSQHYGCSEVRLLTNIVHIVLKFYLTRGFLTSALLTSEAGWLLVVRAGLSFAECSAVHLAFLNLNLYCSASIPTSTPASNPLVELWPSKMSPGRRTKSPLDKNHQSKLIFGNIEFCRQSALLPQYTPLPKRNKYISLNSTWELVRNTEA